MIGQGALPHFGWNPFIDFFAHTHKMPLPLCIHIFGQSALIGQDYSSKSFHIQQECENAVVFCAILFRFVIFESYRPVIGCGRNGLVLAEGARKCAPPISCWVDLDTHV